MYDIVVTEGWFPARAIQSRGHGVKDNSGAAWTH